MSLYIHSYYIDSTPAKSIGDRHVGLKIRCALPGWLQKMEWGTIANSRRAAYAAVTEEQGWRQMVYRPGRNLVQGWTRHIEAQGRLVRYECNGTWSRADDDYHTTAIPPDDTVSEAVAALVQSVDAMRYDAAYITTNSTELEEFGTDLTEDGPGIRPGKGIEALLQMSDASYNKYEFYTQALDQGLKPNISKDRAYYVQREPIPTNPDFVLRLSDLTRDKVAADIFNLTTQVQVRYGKVTGSHDGPDGHQYLTDSTVDFRALGVQSGDYVLNQTKTISNGFPVYMYVADIINDGHTLTGGAGYTWATNDEYVVRLQDLATTTATASNTAKYWEVKGTPLEAPELTATQAVNLATEYVNRLSVPAWHIPFTVGRDSVRLANGARVSVWELLRKPFVVAVEDDQNVFAGLDYSLSARRAYYVVAVDADYDQRVVTLTIGEDHRLDAILQRAGITPGQAIQPEPRGGGGRGGPAGSGEPWWLHRHWHREKWEKAGEWDPRWIGDHSAAPEGWPG